MAKVILAAAGALFLAQSSLPPAFPREGMEVSFQNERVLIWKGLAGVFLDAGGISKATFPDGTSSTRETPTVRGDLAYSTKGVVHVEEWLTDDIRAVVVAMWEYQWQPGRQVPLHAQTRDSVIVPLERRSYPVEPRNPGRRGWWR